MPYRLTKPTRVAILLHFPNGAHSTTHSGITFATQKVILPACPRQLTALKTAEKDPADLALENTVVDWLKDHQPGSGVCSIRIFGRGGIMPSDSTVELGENRVGAVSASHHRDQEYGIIVDYVLTRGGLPETMQTYQHPQVHYDQQQSFTVRFDGTRLQFL